MVERFYAEIELDGDNKGALAAIAATNAAINGLKGKKVPIDVSADTKAALKNVKTITQAASKSFEDLNKDIRRTSKGASRASAAEYKQLVTQAATARTAIKTAIEGIQGELRKGSLAPSAKTFLNDQLAALRVMDNQASQIASRASTAASKMDGAFRNAEKGAKRAAEATERLNQALGSTSKNSDVFRKSLRGQNKEFDSLLKSATGYETALKNHYAIDKGDRDGRWQVREGEILQNLADKRTQAAKIAESAAREQNKLDDLHGRALTENAKRTSNLTAETQKYAAATETANKALAEDLRLHRDKAALNSADVWNRDRVAIEQSADALNRVQRARVAATNAEADYNRTVSSRGESHPETVAAAQRMNDATGERIRLEREYSGYQDRSVASANARVAAIDKEADAVDNLNRKIRDQQDMQRRHQDLLGRYNVMQQYPGAVGERMAAEMYQASSLDDYNRAMRELNNLRANYRGAGLIDENDQAVRGMRGSADAARNMAGAYDNLRGATYRLADSQLSLNNAMGLNGNAARYMMYDAGQYQMMMGLAMAAPAALGLLAYGNLESRFSDVQRTAGIDNAGFLEDGSRALGLYDGRDTASDRAFRGLLDIGSRIPVGYNDIFDMASKAGSVGIEGRFAVEGLTTAVAKFNTVSDTAKAAETLEAMGRISNLMVDTNYDGIASAIVNTGKAAAATDDQIIKTTQELSQAAAGANFATHEIVGLAGGFASLSIPPERARSVFMNLVTEMSKGMASTTPEIENMAKLLGSNVDAVRSLWKEDPAELFMQMSQALGSMDETQMVTTLEGLGLEGQRAVPMFQAIAKNMRESAKGADVISKSMSAAAEGYGDVSILNDAVAAKTDDLAGSLRLIVNEAMQFATLLGAGVDNFLRFVPILDMVQNVLRGMNTLMDIPGVGQLVGAASTIMGMLGLVRAISGGSLLLQAGRMALLNAAQGIPGGSAGLRAGNIRYLLTGETVAPVRNQQPGVAPVPAGGGSDPDDSRRRQTPTGTRAPQGSYGVPAPVYMGDVDAANKRQSEAADRAARGLAGVADESEKSSSGFKRARTQIAGFLGGKAGITMLTLIGAAAGIGALTDVTQQQDSDDSAKWQARFSDNLVSTTEDGKVVLKDLSSIVRAWGSTAGGAITWTDKLGAGATPWETTKDFVAPLQKLLKDGNLSKLLEFDKSEAPGTPLLGGPYAGLYDELGLYDRMGVNTGVIGKVSDLSKSQEALKQLSDEMARRPFEEQLQFLNYIQDELDLPEKRMGEVFDLLGDDFWDSFIVGLNAADPDVDIGYESTERNREKAALLSRDALENYETSGGQSITDPGRSYDTITSQTHRGSVMAEYMGTAAATNAAMQAEFSYHNAVESGVAWLDEYSGVIRDHNGELDWSVQSNQEMFGVMSSLAGTTQTRITAMKDEGATLQEIREYLDEGVESFTAFADAAGLSQAEIDFYLAELGLVPEEIITKLITEQINTGDMTFGELLDIVSSLPEGETITIEADAITDEAKEALEALGFTVTENTEDGTITITALTSEAQAELDKITSYDGNTVVFSIQGASDGSVEQVIGVVSELGGTIDLGVEIDQAGYDRLTELGAKVIEVTNEDGTVTTKVEIPAGMGPEKIQEIIDVSDELTDKDITVSVTTKVNGNPMSLDAWRDQLKLWTEFGGADNPLNPINRPAHKETHSLESQHYAREEAKLKADPHGYISDIMGPGTAGRGGVMRVNGMPGLAGMSASPSGGEPVITPAVELDPATNALGSFFQAFNQNPEYSPVADVDANTQPATMKSLLWSGFAGGLNPMALMGSNTNPALAASLGWYGFAGGLNPMAPMGSNPAMAMAASMGWFGFAGALFPNPLMTTNPAMAMMLAQMWFMMANMLRPNPVMTANAGPATATAMAWYYRVNSMRPHATITASANTWSAEAALNYAARPRVSVITAVTTGAGGGGGGMSEGGFTGRGGKYEVGGVYHRGEYIIPREHVNQSTGRPDADALGRIFPGVRAPQTIQAASNDGGGFGGIVELGPNSLHQLAQRVVELQLDGSTVASNTSRHYATSTRRGTR